MTIEEIEARLDVGCATDDDMAYLLDRVRKLERAHAWFVENAEHAGTPGEDGAKRCVCGAYQDWIDADVTTRHEPDCEWVKAKELRL